MDVSAIIATASLKFRWKIFAVYGKKNFGKLLKGGRTRGKAEHDKTEQERANVRQEADILWKERPNFQDNNTETEA